MIIRGMCPLLVPRWKKVEEMEGGWEVYKVVM